MINWLTKAMGSNDPYGDDDDDYYTPPVVQKVNAVKIPAPGAAQNAEMPPMVPVTPPFSQEAVLPVLTAMLHVARPLQQVFSPIEMLLKRAYNKEDDLAGLTSKGIIFNASDWKERFPKLSSYEISLDDEPPLDFDTFTPLLKQFSALRVETGEPSEEKAEIAFITMPKGLSFRKFCDIVKQENTIKLNGRFDSFFMQENQDQEVEETYRFFATLGVLKGSLGESLKAQKALLQGHGCEKLTALEVAVLMVTSGQSPYSNNPETFTHCKARGGSTAIGNFSRENGFSVYRSIDHQRAGMGAALRLEKDKIQENPRQDELA